MNPQNNNIMGAAQPTQAASPQAAQAPQQQPQPQQAGEQDYLSFMKELYNLLLLRIEAAGQQNPNFGQAIDNGISPEAAQEMFIILPEMKVIFDAIDSVEGHGGAAPIQQGQAPQQQSDNPLIAQGQVGGVSRGLVG